MSYRRLQLRRGKKADMPTLAVGEIAFTTDENKLYVGDGTTNHCVSSTNDYTTAEKNKVANLPSDTNTALSNKVDKVSGKGLSTNDYTNTEQTKLGALNAAIIVKSNVSVATSAWASDTTYTDYPYRASIPITGCTANHIPEAVFSLADAISGTFSPVAETYAGGVYIYASEKPSAAITIPTIKLTKVVE